MVECDVAIIGGGPAGLGLATELKRLGVANVTLLEREEQAGGVPRHCGHFPFGLREARRLLRGPDYARLLVARAEAAGVDIRTGTTVTALNKNANLSLSNAEGQTELQARRVVICTGVREASRAQRLLSGTRPQGVITTGALQNMVYLHQQRPFRNPVILGSELVSFSAIRTCRHLGMKPLAFVEENPRVTLPLIMRPYPALLGIPLFLGATNLRIHGDNLLTGISFTSAKGQQVHLKTDGLILTGKFRPEAALLHGSPIEIDPGTGGPVIDQYGRCSDPSYFCAGNLLRPVETAGWCWQEGIETARRVADDLARGAPLEMPSTRLFSDDPAIRFVVPQRLSALKAPFAMQQMQIRLTRPAQGYLIAQSAGKTLWTDFLQSRPERRILAPLAPVLKPHINAPVSLKLLEGN